MKLICLFEDVQIEKEAAEEETNESFLQSQEQKKEPTIENESKMEDDMDVD